MYQPNFCAECGAKVVRESWHLWTSRRFCDACAPRFRKKQILWPVLMGSALVGFGAVSGRVTQTPPAPVVIEQRAAPVVAAPAPAPVIAPTPAARAFVTQPTATPIVTEIAYTCGARTKKGTPCTRRVRVPGRCWQHPGQPAMLPQEQLIIRK